MHVHASRGNQILQRKGKITSGQVKEDPMMIAVDPRVVARSQWEAAR